MKGRAESTFRTIFTPPSAKVAKSYTKKSQLARFKRIIGDKQHYIDARNFVARGHAAPDRDFIFSTHRAASFCHVNVIPQFQSINNGNLKDVEGKTRILAILAQTILEIYTGTYGTLFLTNDRGGKVPITLSDTDQIVVPKYVFKIVFHRSIHAAIVFITSNNPFMKLTEFKPFCKDVCKEAKMSFSQDPRKGLTFCCEYLEFAKVVGIKKDRVAPIGELDVRHLLTSTREI